MRYVWHVTKLNRLFLVSIYSILLYHMSRLVVLFRSFGKHQNTIMLGHTQLIIHSINACASLFLIVAVVSLRASRGRSVLSVEAAREQMRAVGVFERSRRPTAQAVFSH